jgi:hypothetical protein
MYICVSSLQIYACLHFQHENLLLTYMYVYEYTLQLEENHDSTVVSLRTSLEKRKYQSHTDADMRFLQPTLIPIAPPTSPKSDVPAPVSVAVCLPCYNEEWSEMSGTLRSLANNIHFCRKRMVQRGPLHVSVFIIQDGWKKASYSLKKGIETEFGTPSADYLERLVNKDGYKENVTICIPEYELFYPSTHGASSDLANILHDQQNIKDGKLGATFFPIFITKSRNAQKFNSHKVFFSLCSLLRPDFVFLTDCGTIYNNNCLANLVDYLAANKHQVAGGMCDHIIYIYIYTLEVCVINIFISVFLTNICIVSYRSSTCDGY